MSNDADPQRAQTNIEAMTAGLAAIARLTAEVERLQEVNKAIRAERDALFDASMKLRHEERPVRMELRMAKVETARLRALVEEACDLGVKAAYLPHEGADWVEQRNRLAAIRDEAKGAK